MRIAPLEKVVESARGVEAGERRVLRELARLADDWDAIRELDLACMAQATGLAQGRVKAVLGSLDKKGLIAVSTRPGGRLRVLVRRPLPAREAVL